MLYPGVSLITLGVGDVARSRAFYERVGWRCSQGASTAQCAFFILNNVALALYDQSALDRETGASAADGDGRPRFALAQNHGSPASVDEALRRALAAGAGLISQGAPAHWGGYTALFADPDGHVWELAWNPAFPLGADGTIDVPP
ncbi:MAG: VOC family protein [Beijerinckiaceae bacterium]|nr:VOC family protein [Beijerinckiaceae bacterium]